MFTRLSHFFACMLVLLIPLQGFAAANMSICNSLMQAETNYAKQQEVQTTPCHEHMAGMTKTSGDLSNNHLGNNHSSKHKSACKTNCATLCNSLCAMTALPSNIKPATLQDTSRAMTLFSQSYASITLPSPQRPPILLP